MDKFKKLSKQEFDEIIKNNLIMSGMPKEKFGYDKDVPRTYQEYYTHDVFEDFVKKMKTKYPKHYDKFRGIKDAKEDKGGQGGELIPKKGRWGTMPPKMASVASSSRFCYLALRDGTDALSSEHIFTKDDVEFEKECKIFNDATSIAPQLDACIKADMCDYYIEAKCHEIFDSHKIELKNKYWDVLEEKGFSSVLKRAVKHEETFEFQRDVFNLPEEHKRFDVKQFICHLLGIAEQSKGRKAKLVYLFFMPVCKDEILSKKVKKVFCELQKEICALFSCEVITTFCKENQIELIAIAEHSDVMTKLDRINMKKLFPIE